MDDELTIEERWAMRWKARVALLHAFDQLGGEGERTELIARALELAEFTEREHDAPAPPNVVQKYPRFAEYVLSRTLTDFKRERLVETPAWGIWRLIAWKRAGRAAPSAERLAELQSMPYQDYLDSPEWRAMENAALLRFDHHCALDERHRSNLAAQHISRERLGSEQPRDLIVLCQSCRERHDSDAVTPRVQPKRFPVRSRPARAAPAPVLALASQRRAR